MSNEVEQFSKDILEQIEELTNGYDEEYDLVEGGE